MQLLRSGLLSVILKCYGVRQMYFGIVLLAGGVCCASRKLRRFITLPLPIFVLPSLLYSLPYINYLLCIVP